LLQNKSLGEAHWQLANNDMSIPEPIQWQVEHQALAKKAMGSICPQGLYALR
jgi:hypothetical protein